MTEEKKLEPELRFPGFHEPWEEKKLGDFGEVSSCKRVYERETSDSGDVPFFKIGTFGREADAYISNNLFEEYKEKYNFPKKGDILISASGTIGRIIKYNGERAYFQDSNIVWFDIKEKGLINEFLYNFYQTVSWNKLEGGTIKRLYNKDLLNLIIRYPSLPEQEKIGKFFSTIDKKLNLQRERVEELKSYKKGMMQRIFDQEIRFKDENGRDYPDWKEDTINYFIKNKYLRLIKSKDLQKFTGERVYLSTSSIVEDKIIDTEGTITYNNRPSRAQMIPLENSVWFAKMKNSLKVFLADKYSENKYILSTGFYGFLPNQVKVDSNYLKQLFLSSFFDVQKNLYSEGTSMSAIKDDHFNFIKLLIPSLQEQEKIANFLSAIDRRIELEEEKLGLYEDFKKGLMQRMFV